MAKAVVYTDNYREMYGKAPRGSGTWTFFIISSRGVDYDEPIIVSGKYAEARDQAIRIAKSWVGGFEGLILGT